MVSKRCHDWEQRSLHQVSPGGNTHRVEEENDDSSANFPRRKLDPLSYTYSCGMCTCCKYICILDYESCEITQQRLISLHLRKNVSIVKF